MDNLNSSLLFLLVSTCLALVIIWKRESIPERLRRPLATATLVMVSAAFIMLVVSLFKMD